VPCAIGIDLGGTNLRAALVDHKGKVLAFRRQSAEAAKGRDFVVASLLNMATQLLEEATKRGLTVLGVGAGIPGIIEDGVVYQSPHFSDWVEFDIQKAIAHKLSYPVHVDNDANCVALGEAWLGSARGLTHFILLTLGTGIGGGLYMNGQLWKGESGFAGEMGHMVIEVFGPPCACGSRGCWELYCSASGMKRLMTLFEDVQSREVFEKKLGKDIFHVTIEDLYQGAKEGDIFSNAMFKKFGYYLGVGIASLVNALDIETFVMGGGISCAWNFFIEETHKSLAKRTYKETSKRVKLIQAQLGDQAGVLGAASVFLSV